jgi:tetratricopeptide (TPR) repeat protein
VQDGIRAGNSRRLNLHHLTIRDLAKSKSAVAFGMSVWPQAVAEAALRSQPPLQELLLNHLREHRSLINQATHDWIKDLFKRDVLDPLGEQVRGWVKAGEAGVAVAAATVKKAAESGRWDEAIAAARRYIELFPFRGPYDAQVAIGMCYMGKADPAQAIVEFDKVLSQYPDRKPQCAQALLQKGLCQKTLGQLAAAKSTFEQVIQAYPNGDAASKAKQELALLAGEA